MNNVNEKFRDSIGTGATMIVDSFWNSIASSIWANLDSKSVYDYKITLTSLVERVSLATSSQLRVAVQKEADEELR